MTVNFSNSEYSVDRMTPNVNMGSEHQFLSTSLVVQSLDSVPMEGVPINQIKAEVNEESKLYSHNPQQALSQKGQKYQVGPRSMAKKRSKKYSNGKLKTLAPKQVDAKLVALLLPTKEAQEEVLKYEVYTAFQLSIFFNVHASGTPFSILSMITCVSR